MTLMYKVRNGLVPDYIGELFNFKNKVYSLRNAEFDVPGYLINSKTQKILMISGLISLVQTIPK